MAGALAQRARKAGRLGAAYFCRHNDGTRNDPRYLLGTVACHFCYCNSEYNNLVGGEDGVRMMLANSKLGVQELCTKLLEEPLSKCKEQQRKLVIIDALDETEYESREDFLHLIKERFLRLPKWVVFFITSRPEHTIQSRLEKYNPCVRICAGNSEEGSFYKHHEQDIQRFLEKRVDFSRLPHSVENIIKMCNGLFLYAFYIVKVLNDSGKIDQLSDLFPGNIDDFFRKNFKRLYDKLGKDIFKKFFGCLIVAPSPLPVTIIEYILEREKSTQDEQEVIDVVSLFVVFRATDRSLTFLHNLIPAWLTNKEKAGKLFIDTRMAGEYLNKIVTEILSTIDEAQKPLATVDKRLKDYVLRVAVQFLCHHGDKDSMKLVFNCLTSYHYLQQRIQSGRIEIYNLLEDLRLVADCYVLEDAHKQKILQEICLAFESNFPVLLECPHLLRSCLLNSSSVVQEHVLMHQVSGPRLEWIVCDVPSIEDLSDFKYFATTFDKTTAAVVKGNSILLVDASTLKTVGGPFEISQDTIEEITCLEFSPDDKWLFFGRLDKWFSVERGCIEDFSQFSGNSLVYKWGLFTPDGQYIVVKRDKVFDFQQTCQNMFCVLDFLSLWALLEIDQGGVGKLTCWFSELSKLMAAIVSPMGGQAKRLLKFLGMDPTWRQTGVTPVPYYPSCYSCGRLRELTESNQISSLSAVRRLISDLYPRIFYYQVWNLQTGRSLLENAFCQGGQLNPITYVCHLTSAFTKLRGRMWCSGIDKAVSIANIATVNAVYALECVLLSKEVCLQASCSNDELELTSEEELELMWDQMRELELKQEWVWREQQEWVWREQQEQLPEGELEWNSKQLQNLKQEQWWVCEWKTKLKWERKRRQEQQQEIVELNRLLMWKVGWLQKREVKELWEPDQELEQLWEWERELKQLWELGRELEQLWEQKQNPEQLENLRKWDQEQLWEWELEQLRKWGLQQKQLLKKKNVLEILCGPEKLWGQQQGLEKLWERQWEREQERKQKMERESKQLQERHLKPLGVHERRQLQERQLDLIQLQTWEHNLKQLREMGHNLKQHWEMQLEKVMEQSLAQVREKNLEKLWEQELEELWKNERKLKQLQKLEWRLEQLLEQEQRLGKLQELEQLRELVQKRKLERLWEEILAWASYWTDMLRERHLQRGCLWGHFAMQFVYMTVQQWKLEQQWEWRQEQELEFQLELEMKQMRERVWEWQRELEQTQWELKEKRGLDLELEQHRQKQRLHQRLRLCKMQLGPERNRKHWMQDLRWWELEQKQMWKRELEREWERVQKGMQEFRNLSSRKTKQKTIFSSNFPQRSSVVVKSIAAAFTSSDTVMSVCSDLILALWNHRVDEEKGFSFIFVSESSLSGSPSQVSHIENWIFSDNGKRAACRQGNKIQLYSIAHSVEILCTLLEGEFFDKDIVYLTFSADNTFLLICIQDGMNEPRFYEWDFVKKIMSSFESPGLLTVECCCLSSDKTRFILCGEYDIEIWEYNKRLIRLLARSCIGKKCSVKFRDCGVSLDNELVVCCIENVIIVFGLHAPDVFSSKKILRGHIGRVEFCKFLRVNRYLISCGVDGMVFLWDLIEAKAVGFARVTQGQESIVSVAVSPEEEIVVCFTSSARVCVMRLWNLECALPSKLVRESMKGKAEVTQTSLQLAGEVVSRSKPISYADDCKITDVSSPEEDERFCLTSEDFLSSGNESD